MAAKPPSEPAQQPARAAVVCPVERASKKPASKRLEAQRRKRAVVLRALRRAGLSAAEIAALVAPAQKIASKTTKSIIKPARKSPVRTLAVRKPAVKKSVRKKPVTITRHAGMRSAVARLEADIETADHATRNASSAGDLVERVGRAIERELEGIERIIGGDQVPLAQRTEAERRARTLASLARTLSEVTKLRAITRAAATETAKAADDDTMPRDLDEFRRELSRRLEFMVAAAAAVPAAGDDAG